MIRVTTYMEEDLYEAIKKLSRDEERTASAVIRRATRQYLHRYGHRNDEVKNYLTSIESPPTAT